MSAWTYINGCITVAPLGRTQPEKRYVLDTVITHLPRVTGSEGNMHTYVIQRSGYDGFCTHDEFGQFSNLGDNRKLFTTQSTYMIVVDAVLRDREFEITYKEFINWLCRLSKRVNIDNVLVEITGFNKSAIIRNINDVYGKMFEAPSWFDETGEPTWSEYMMFERVEGEEYPLILERKYSKKTNDNDWCYNSLLRYSR